MCLVITQWDAAAASSPRLAQAARKILSEGGRIRGPDDAETSSAQHVLPSLACWTLPRNQSNWRRASSGSKANCMKGGRKGTPQATATHTPVVQPNRRGAKRAAQEPNFYLSQMA